MVKNISIPLNFTSVPEKSNAGLRFFINGFVHNLKIKVSPVLEHHVVKI
jgi:hypothetical protein